VVDEAHGVIFDEFANGAHQAVEESFLHRVRREWDKWVCRAQVAAGGVAMITATVVGDAQAAKTATEVVKMALKLEAEREKYRQVGEKACKVAGGGGE
jgi:hypothetical protein